MFCAPCASTIVPLDPPENPSEVVGFGAYGGALSEAIRRFKYQQRSDLARPLGQLAARAAAPLLTGDSLLLVPVPMDPRKLRYRGYNQAALLAREVGRHWGIAVSFSPLRRCRQAQAQASLSHHERVQNLAGAFTAQSSPVTSASNIVLIDDVVTTGATWKEAATCLRQAGWNVRGISAVACTPKYGKPSNSVSGAVR